MAELAQELEIAHGVVWGRVMDVPAVLVMHVEMLSPSFQRCRILQAAELTAVAGPLEDSVPVSAVELLAVLGTLI
jgi:hypothetical protein